MPALLSRISFFSAALLAAPLASAQDLGPCRSWLLPESKTQKG